MSSVTALTIVVRGVKYSAGVIGISGLEIAEGTKPGKIALIVTPLPVRMGQRDRVRPTSAYLVAQ